MLLEENPFAFVNGGAADAKEYVEKNRDDCDGEKKAIFHVMNDGDIHRLEAYLVEDPFKLGSYYLIEELTCLIFKRSVVAQILSWYIISYFK